MTRGLKPTPEMTMLGNKIKAAIKSNRAFYHGLFPIVEWARKIRHLLRRGPIGRFRDYCALIPEYAPEAMFVKVGANDGVVDDPCSRILFSPGWKGLLIEPVPYCFERLKKNYSDSTRYMLAQVAIGARPGKTTFYYVGQEAPRHLPDLPSWYDQLGSFNREHIVKHLGPAVEPFVVAQEVEVCSLAEIVRRNGIRDIHLLHIDTEGYDYEVLKTCDFDRCKPVLIFIEHKHLSVAHKAEMRALLRKQGYSIADCGGDYFALNVKGFKGLRRKAKIVR